MKKSIISILIFVFLGACANLFLAAPAYSEQVDYGVQRIDVVKADIFSIVLDQLKQRRSMYMDKKEKLYGLVLNLQAQLQRVNKYERYILTGVINDELQKEKSRIAKRISSLMALQNSLRVKVEMVNIQIDDYEKQKGLLQEAVLKADSLKEERQSFFKDENMKERNKQVAVSSIIEYRIAPNDELQINVYGEPDLTKTVRVAADGGISYPLLGRIKVDGLSAQELEEKIGKLLSERGYIINPQVSVYIEKFSTIAVLGEVRNAGSFQFKGKLSILDAIAQAGGFNINANTSSVKIMRAEDSQQKIIEVDLGDVRKGVRGAETVLKANDTIFVEKIGKVIVLGEVNRPGAFELKDKMTALEAIAIGGGFSDMADKNNVKILRIENDQQEMLQVRLVDLGEDIENSEIILKPNDTIYVEKIGKVVVLGEVVRPGTFDLKERTTVLEAIAMAGGFTKIAAINSTRVIRKNAGIKKVMRIKVTDITRKGDKKKDIEVLPGDIIFVPESLF